MNDDYAVAICLAHHAQGMPRQGHELLLGEGFPPGRESDGERSSGRAMRLGALVASATEEEDDYRGDGDRAQEREHPP